MLTLKQCKTNAYVIAHVMQSNISVDHAVVCINDICNLNITTNDLLKLIQLRVNYRTIDDIFNIWE